VRTTEAPPALPNDEQPVCPDEGYLWTPGYWGWGGGRYYWVRGAWVLPPRIGVLWTPGYWGYLGAVYVFHRGYWGPQVGYYGGINYGFGYVGVGFAGGRWVGNQFAYNKTVNNVNANVIHNTYSETVANHVAASKVSYNGGPGGITAAPTAEERTAAAETHIPAAVPQRQNSQQSAPNPAPVYRVNGTRAAIAAVQRSTVSVAPREAALTAEPPAANQTHGVGAPPGAIVNSQEGVSQPRAPKPAAVNPPRTQHPSREQSEF
jgi:WXXGXW repeat (2 copies)